MSEPVDSVSPAPTRRWITRSVLGIVLATFFSDFGHEMCTAVLPLYIAGIGLGPAALGVVEGVADFLVSLAKLGGGVAGHHLREKRPLASLGYLVTTIATSSIGLVTSLPALATLRATAWIGRGFRGPLRDHMLADAVPATHHARAYGLERAGDMLGAVAGPLVATLLVLLGVHFKAIILWALVPGLAAASAMFFLARENAASPQAPGERAKRLRDVRFPRPFWRFLGGVLLFGTGDFSRTFLIWIAARALGEDGAHASGAVSLAVLLYAFHNLVASASAFPAGRLGDKGSKMRILVIGYGIGVATNVLLAVASGSIVCIIAAIVMSGVYISIEETLEKAVAVELLPRETRSLGLGVLACANAVGDMVSSLLVGLLLERGQGAAAFGGAACLGALGVVWMSSGRTSSRRSRA